MSIDTKRVQAVFLGAIDRPEAERPAFLDAECAADPDLRARVDVLLLAHDMPSQGEPPTGDLPSPGFGATMTASPPDDTPTRPWASGNDARNTVAAPTGPSEDMPGEVSGCLLAGRYRLGEVLGEGGMGTVYRAEQIAPVRREVAVKLVKPGMDSRRVLSRFEAERQALALMDHPNIARVLDGGTTDRGRPFFVMELVHGVPLTDYCDERRLPVRDRLALFVLVCQAVQHAHQKGIIHRDLKPNNVLVAEVDGRPVPKVIDFGLAKALSADVLDDLGTDTAAGSILGTPLYMAPEQAEPGTTSADTRTDIYALGVMLYELLTGTTPVDRDTARRVALGEVLRLIREVEPPSPTKRLAGDEGAAGVASVRGSEPARLVREVRGELDWVTMKCIEKDPARRYATANALAADLGRYLAHEPVAAGPPSRWYRGRKFVRRNRAAVTVAGVLLLALVGGIVGTSLGLVRAIQAERVAEHQGKRTQDALDELTGEQEKTRVALTAALEARTLSGQALESLTDVVVETAFSKQETLSQSDRKFLGRIQSFYADYARNGGDSPEARRLQVRGLLRVSSIQDRLGQPSDAEKAAKEAARLADGLEGDDGEATGLRSEARQKLGVLVSARGDRDGGRAELLAAIALRQKWLEGHADDAAQRRGLIDAYEAMALTYHARHGYAVEATKWFRLAAPESEVLMRQPTPSVADRTRRVGALVGLAGCLSQPDVPDRDIAVALGLYEEAKVVVDAVLAARAGDAGYRVRLGNIHNNSAILYDRVGDPARAQSGRSEALLIADGLDAEFPLVHQYRLSAATCRANRGSSWPRGDPRAVEDFRWSADAGEALALKYPDNLDYQQRASLWLRQYAVSLASARSPLALAAARRAESFDAGRMKRMPGEASARTDAAVAKTDLGNLYVQSRDFPAAGREYSAALALLEGLADPVAAAAEIALVHENRAHASSANAEPAASATAHLRGAIAWRQKAFERDPAQWYALNGKLQWLAAHLNNNGLPAEARPLLDRAENLLAGLAPSSPLADAWDELGGQWISLADTPRALACYDKGQAVRLRLIESAAPPVRGFRELRDGDYEALLKWVADLPPGWRPTAIHPRPAIDPPRFDAVAIDGFPTAKVEATLGWLPHLPKTLMDSRQLAEFTPVGLTSLFERDGLRCRLDLWGSPPSFWFGASHPPDDAAGFAQKKAEGLRPVNLHYQSTPEKRGGDLGIWYDKDTRDWKVVRDHSLEMLVTDCVAERGKGYRPAAADLIAEGDRLRFAVAFVENPARVRWEFAAGLAPEEYAQVSVVWKAAGLRPLEVMGHGKPDAPRVSAFWVAADAERRESIRSARLTAVHQYGERVRELDPARALEAFREEVALSPASIPALYALAQVQAELGQWGGLVETCGKVAISPGVGPWPANLAIGLLMTGKVEEASRYAGPDYYGYLRVLMFAYAGQNRRAEAEMKVLLGRDRDSASADIATHYARVGWLVPGDSWDADHCLQLNRRSILASNTSWGHYSLAVSLLRSGRPAEAEAELLESIRLDPNWAPGTVELVRSMVARELGRDEEARRRFAEGCRRPERFWGLHFHFYEYWLVRREAEKVFAPDYDPKVSLGRRAKIVRDRLAEVEAKRANVPTQAEVYGGWARSVRGPGWTVRDGILSSPAGQTNDACIVSFGDPMWTDYDFSLEFQYTGPAEKGTPGRICVGTRALVETAKLETFTFGAEENGTHLAQVYKPQMVTLARAPGSLEKGRWYKVRVEVRGKSYRYRLDDKILFEFEDDICPRGMVQLDAIRVGASFRNIRVTDPKGAVLWSGPPRLGIGEAAMLREEEESLRRELAGLEARLAGRPMPPPEHSRVRDFREVHGADAATLRQWLKDLPEGFRPVALTTRASTEPARFDAVAIDDGRPVEWLAHLGLDAPGADVAGMLAGGWNLNLATVSYEGGQYRRSHVWTRGGGGTSAGWTEGKSEKLAPVLRQAEAARLRPTAMHGGVLPDLIFGPDEGRAWEFHYGLDPVRFAAKIDEHRRRGYRPDALHAAGSPDEPRFTVVLVSDPGNADWFYRQRMTAAEYEAEVATQRERGWRPHAVVSHGYGIAVRYAAVWVAMSPAGKAEVGPMPRESKSR